MLVYIGTYTGKKSEGIYMARFDDGTGKLSTPELAAKMKNPSFLAVHPNGQFLYAVGEIDQFDGRSSGEVSAFSLNPTSGKLTFLNHQASGGTGPCHLALDRAGKCVLVANYGSGSVEALPISKTDGKLAESGTIIQHEGSSVNKERQAGPHAHFITADSANKFALACDLGIDKVLVYRLRSSAEPRDILWGNTPAGLSIKPGSGPRHLAIHPNGKFVYLINELSSTMTTLSYDRSHGVLEELQTMSTLPEDFKGQNSCAEVQIHPSGKFVYGSNRGHNSIAVFAIDSKTGKLSSVTHQATQGETPRHFAIDPSGKWLLAENQDSDNITIFSIDQGSGHLNSTGQVNGIGSPVCVVFVPVK
jgi:6-phosphogluconolactonase